MAGLAVPVVLLGAVVLATRAGSGEQTPAAAPSVADDLSSIGGDASGHTQGGAQSAAARYATALGSEAMFNPSTRHPLVESIADPSAVAKMQADYDRGYSAEFLRSLGLDAGGQPPVGEVFVSRTTPGSATVTSYTEGEATVAVRCSGVLSRTGPQPIAQSSNFTMTFRLRWSGTEWKLLESTQD
ncbi:hypothetical protein ACWF95_34130 [Streptomyces vinaceus]